METKKRIKLLKDVSLFSQLNDAARETIAKIAQEETIPENTEFIEEGTEGNTLYIIVSGLVRVYKLSEEGKEIPIALRQTCDVIGEMALLDNEARSASIKTLQETHVLKITQQQFTDLLLQHPTIAIELLKVFSKRIRDSIHHIHDIQTKELPDRTLHALQILAPYFPNNDIALSHEELAEIVGATRPRITESLNQLQNENKITLSSKNIHVN